MRFQYTLSVYKSQLAADSPFTGHRQSPLLCSIRSTHRSTAYVNQEKVRKIRLLTSEKGSTLNNPDINTRWAEDLLDKIANSVFIVLYRGWLVNKQHTEKVGCNLTVIADFKTIYQ